MSFFELNRHEALMQFRDTLRRSLGCITLTFLLINCTVEENSGTPLIPPVDTVQPNEDMQEPDALPDTSSSQDTLVDIEQTDSLSDGSAADTANQDTLDIDTSTVDTSSSDIEIDASEDVELEDSTSASDVSGQDVNPDSSAPDSSDDVEGPMPGDGQTCQRLPTEKCRRRCYRRHLNL